MYKWHNVHRAWIVSPSSVTWCGDLNSIPHWQEMAQSLLNDTVCRFTTEGAFMNSAHGYLPPQVAQTNIVLSPSCLQQGRVREGCPIVLRNRLRIPCLFVDCKRHCWQGISRDSFLWTCVNAVSTRLNVLHAWSGLHHAYANSYSVEDISLAELGSASRGVSAAFITAHLSTATRMNPLTMMTLAF